MVSPDKRIGEFLNLWKEIEKLLILTSPKTNTASQINYLKVNKKIASECITSLHVIRQFRNDMIHSFEGITALEIEEKTLQAREVLDVLKNS